ncbi:SBP (S-ribonuclease binding protein) family protein [Raphanus sativus]|uniref:Probable BOI-related E3 ubiquitin-protein ligase 3 n=1 Tax=Raphanus sativus TaxID=3726 RepID=A0A6J0KQK3_RAPSA|nr:probable BOI-related E3 ubiquitin-protein ligase 3 [Raphanus sativus]KAJ4880792.1 SBP (S-ribonuclease binding protein) family protein [Raphanus sativus]
MAIQAQLHYNASNANQIGTGGSLINNNGGIGIGIDQSYNLQSQKDLNQHALFQHQQYRSQSVLDAYMERQRQEIDQFIRVQNERLRYALQEQRRQETETMLRKMETNALVLMTRKEEEMSRALSKNMELEDLLRKMEMENQTWQRMARESEAMVATLSSTLEQVRERAAASAACYDEAAVAVEDEGSCCGGGDGFPAEKVRSCCWNCGSDGETRVLFLPCRHLCCCTGCEEGLVLCPICSTPKKNRIEAFIF